MMNTNELNEYLSFDMFFFICIFVDVHKNEDNFDLVEYNQVLK